MTIGVSSLREKTLPWVVGKGKGVAWTHLGIHFILGPTLRRRGGIGILSRGRGGVAVTWGK